MKKIILITILLIFALEAFAQEPIHRYKFYDDTKVEDYQKFKRKRLTVDVDSTTINVYAWGDECFFKINLTDQMELTADSIKTTTINNANATRLFAPNFRFQMYINKVGNFEFDAKIKKKSPNGRYEIPFDIQSKGLSFHFQPELTQERKDAGDTQQEELINSYAVMHTTKKHNRKIISDDKKDTTYANYGTGNAFDLKRIKVWDSAGDTAWGTTRIVWDSLRGDISFGKMYIGADSTWKANAVHPVTYDPQIGRTDIGGLATTLADQIRFMRIDMTENGILDSIVHHSAGFGSNRYYGAIYSDSADAGEKPKDLLEAETVGSIPSNWSTGNWEQLPMAGTTNLVSGTSYWIAVGSWATTTQSRIHYNSITDTSRYYQEDDLTAFPDPVTAQGPTGNDDLYLSIYAVYTVSGAEPFKFRRRRLSK